MKMNGFTKAAQEGIVTVEFTKIGTDELRIMPCTLNRELSENNVPEVVDQQDTSDHLVVWALDKEAWRSFRTSTVKRWYKGGPDSGPDVRTD